MCASHPHCSGTRKQPLSKGKEWSILTGKMSNFCFPIGEPIHNDRVKLIAFDVDLHSSAFVTETWNYPQMLKDTPSGPFQTVDEFKNLVTPPDSVSTFASWNPKTFVFSVIDTTRPSSPEDKDGELAGLIGYDNASKVSRSAELYICAWS